MTLNWKITASVREGAVFIIEAGKPGFPIVTTDTPERAVFVHRACEAHQGLVEVLLKVREYVRLVGITHPASPYPPEHLARIDAALAAAGAP